MSETLNKGERKMLKDYEIKDMVNEEVVTLHNGQRWQYVRVEFVEFDCVGFDYVEGRFHNGIEKNFSHRYYHLDCDSIVGTDGRCLMCENLSPCCL